MTLRSPSLGRVGQFHVTYANQIAEQRGNVIGGFACGNPTDPACALGPGYTPVDHDQRNTLNTGFTANLPLHTWFASNVYYGSGFTNGSPGAQYPGDYLPQHTTFDVSVGKSFGEHERYKLSLTAMNVANRRILLDNSLTFGGFHFNDPRQIYGEFRWRFHY